MNKGNEVKKIISIFISIIIFSTFLFSTIGDWKSYGDLTTLYDLEFVNNSVLSATSGGLLEFNQITKKLETYTNTDFLDNINISKFYVDKYGTYWIGYNSNPTKITYHTQNGKTKHFDFDFTKISAITSDSTNILIAYEKNSTIGIAHFVRNDDEYSFKDFYDQYPTNLGEIYSLQIFGNNIYIGSENGMFFGNLDNPNLKPSSSWSIINSNTTKDFYSYNDSLFFTQNNSIYILDNGTQKLFDTGINHYLSVNFSSNSNDLFYANMRQIYIKNGNIWSRIYNTNDNISGITVSDEKVFIGLENKGLREISFDGELISNFISNSPVFTNSITFRSMDIDKNGNVYIPHNKGIDIFRGYYWHNLIKTDSTIDVNSTNNSNSFSSDSLAYTLIKSTESVTWDSHISADGYLYFSLTDYNVDKNYLSYEPVVGPGVFFKLNINDYTEYSLYDTTDDIFHGTENMGAGTETYIKMRGIAESSTEDIWVINPYVGNYKSLVCLKSDGTVEHYSTETSGTELQLMPNELIFDKYGRLIIGNTVEQEALNTEGGITIFDIENDEWYLINESNGLADNNVFSVCKDIDGSIWVATSGGVQNFRT
ncbi:MAG: two-component regulator propeller domain-containing protein, partial [Candidatus Marinimicrobia bacterium]|nr:two-component regulator propeller domain-containing protein [Candidatus Neomarinimicrobiota bacterium]